MKRLILSVLALLLIVSPALAAGYDGYLLTAPDTEKMLTWSLSPLDERSAVVYSRPLDLENTPARLTWYQDGKLYRDLAFSALGDQKYLSSAAFVSLGEGRVKVLVPTPVGSTGVPAPNGTDEYLIWRWDAFDWTEEGLQNPVEIFTGARAFYICGPYVLSADCVLDGPRTAYLHDIEGNLLWQCALPVSDTFYLRDVRYQGDQSFLLFGYNRRAAREDIILWLEDGQVTEQASGVFSGWLDGAGGVYTVENPYPGDDQALLIRHLNGDMREDQSRLLTGSRLIKSIGGMTADPETGTCTFYGSAVANSRRIYTVFALTVDSEMNAVSLDVRALDQYYRDYSPKIRLAPDGSPWVFTIDTTDWGFPPALIPFDRLPPSTENIGLALE